MSATLDGLDARAMFYRYTATHQPPATPAEVRAAMEWAYRRGVLDAARVLAVVGDALPTMRRFVELADGSQS